MTRAFGYPRPAVLLASLAAAISVLVPGSAWAEPIQWTVDHQRSSLTLGLRAAGQLIKGRFNEWSAKIVFDEANPAASVVDVQIEMPSLVLSVSQADKMAKDKNWLDVDGFPTARFHGGEFTRLADGTYRAAGELELKGSRQPLDLQVDLKIDQEESHALIQAIILRDAFAIGQGDAAGLAPNEIPISAEIWARRSAPKNPTQ